MAKFLQTLMTFSKILINHPVSFSITKSKPLEHSNTLKKMDLANKENSLTMYGENFRREEEGIAELFNLKSIIENSLKDLDSEKILVKQKIRAIQEEKKNLRRKWTEGIFKFHRNKVSIVDENNSVELALRHLRQMRDQLTHLENSIRAVMGLPEFEANVTKFKESVECAIRFHDEDNLQLQLVKKTNDVREKRVEYTKVESEYTNLVRKIEEERERERARQAEQERIQQEEQARKKQKLETIQNEVLMKKEELSQVPILSPPSLITDVRMAPWKIENNSPSISFSQFTNWKFNFNTSA